MEDPSLRIHEIGVKRHGAAWARANQRAVDALCSSSIKPWDPGVKDAVTRVVLRILDGVRLDAGEEWLPENGRWTPQRTERKTNDDTRTS